MGNSQSTVAKYVALRQWSVTMKNTHWVTMFYSLAGWHSIVRQSFIALIMLMGGTQLDDNVLYPCWVALNWETKFYSLAGWHSIG